MNEYKIGDRIHAKGHTPETFGRVLSVDGADITVQWDTKSHTNVYAAQEFELIEKTFAIGDHVRVVRRFEDKKVGNICWHPDMNNYFGNEGVVTDFIDRDNGRAYRLMFSEEDHWTFLYDSLDYIPPVALSNEFKQKLGVPVYREAEKPDFKVGDKVVATKKFKREDLDFVSEMKKYIGKQGIVDEIVHNGAWIRVAYSIEGLESRKWLWPPDCLKLAEEKRPTFMAGDRVLVNANGKYNGMRGVILTTDSWVAHVKIGEEAVSFGTSSLVHVGYEPIPRDFKVGERVRVIKRGLEQSGKEGVVVTLSDKQVIYVNLDGNTTGSHHRFEAHELEHVKAVPAAFKVGDLVRVTAMGPFKGREGKIAGKMENDYRLSFDRERYFHASELAFADPPTSIGVGEVVGIANPRALKSKISYTATFEDKDGKKYVIPDPQGKGWSKVVPSTIFDSWLDKPVSVHAHGFNQQGIAMNQIDHMEGLCWMHDMWMILLDKHVKLVEATLWHFYPPPPKEEEIYTDSILKVLW